MTNLDMEPIQVEAKRGPTGLEIKSYDAAELFEQASKAYTEGRFADAEQHYLKLLSTFPTSSFAKAALYNLGLVHQEKKEWGSAITRFRAFTQAYPEGSDAKDAWYQLGATHAEARQWRESYEVFLRVLERPDLTADDRVEALARKGFAQLSMGELDNADATFRQVFAFRARIEAKAEERLQTDYYLAFSQYQIAQISHKRSNAVALRWPEAQMNADLEEKARLLLQARRQYIDAVRYGNPRIASMAAFQIGTLFQEFYDSLMGVPLPKNLDGSERQEAREVYYDELRKKLRVVLEKALRGHEHNIELFERLGVETEWVTRSRDAIARLKSMLEPGRLEAGPAEEAATSRPGKEPEPPSPGTPRAPSKGIRPAEPSTSVERQIL